MTTNDDIDALLDEEAKNLPTPDKKGTEVIDTQPKQPTREELLARLKEKKNASRQGRAVKSGKFPSHPLTSIFYCDAHDCLSIMTSDEAKLCPVCKVFCYCSKECQTNDWSIHKNLCGKNPTPPDQERLKLYKEALVATNCLVEKTKTGDYTTVINEVGNYPACMFASISEKSNVLHWKAYLKTPLYTTSPFDTLGQLDKKVRAAMARYPDKKIYVISVLLDRVKDNENSECIIRLFTADAFGAVMNVGAGGKVTQTVAKYSRKTR